MKYLIFDAGPIISLTMNGMLPILEKLKEIFGGKFILPPAVKQEVVDRPIKIKKFKLEALQVQELIDRGVLTMSNEIIPDGKLDRETKRILKIVNGVLRTKNRGEKISIIHNGETACLAFANLLKEDSAIVIDERTTRMLTEAPENLREMMERKLHISLDSNLNLLKELKNFKFIRSAELLFIAYEKNLIEIKKNKDLLDALLYSVKFKGCAISSDEIEEMKRLI